MDPILEGYGNYAKRNQSNYRLYGVIQTYSKDLEAMAKHRVHYCSSIHDLRNLLEVTIAIRSYPATHEIHATSSIQSKPFLVMDAMKLFRSNPILFKILTINPSRSIYLMVATWGE